MPTYNAEATIRSAIDCLLDQTLQDFELVVSDNASTDGTWAIIEEYARRDPRVVGVRQARNIGANGNYSTVFRLAQGRYFKWASSNDWCHPEFLARCVARLEERPDVVLAAPRTRLFAGDLSDYTEYDRDTGFEEADPVLRFHAATTRLALNNVMNGVVRREALARTRLIEHYVGADIVLISHLALLGRISLVDAPLFYRRMDTATATKMMSAEAVHRHHYPVRTLRSLFPAWRRAGGCLHAVFASGLGPRHTWRALRWTLRTTYWMAPELGRDLVDAIGYSLRR